HDQAALPPEGESAAEQRSAPARHGARAGGGRAGDPEPRALRALGGSAMKEQSVYQQLRSQLAYLRLGAVAEQLAPALERAEKEQLSHTRFLERLLRLEVETVEQRRLDGRLRFASFPTEKTLADVDYDAQPALDRNMVEELATLRFIEEKGNVLLIGPPASARRCSRSRSAGGRW